MHIRFTLFSHYQNVTPREVSCTWSELVKSLVSHETRERKEDGPLFSPAVYPRGSTRSNGAVQEVSFGVLDIDSLTPQTEPHFLDLVQQYPGAVVLTSSYSHTEENPKFRLVVPFSRPVKPHEWAAVWVRLRARFGSYADPQAKDLARAYYTPAHPPGQVPYTYCHEGSPLDIDTLLATAPPVQEIAKLDLVPVSRDALQKAVSSLQKSHPLQADTLRTVLKGEKWADTGYRDTTLYALCRELVRLFPNADPESIAKHFEQACSHWSDFPTSVVADKLRRLQAQQTSERVWKEEQERTQRTALLQISNAQPSDFEGADPRSLIIQHGPSYWVFAGRTKGYQGPYPASGTPNAAQMWLTAAGQLVELYQPSGRLRDVADLAVDYMSQATDVVYDYTAQVSSWDRDKLTLTLAPCPLVQTIPEYHPGIDEWLKIATGDEYEEVCKWVAWATVDHPCVMLYLSGPPSTGKSLFAQGVASLWGQDPVPLETVFGAFDGDRIRCPLYLGDEHVPKDHKGRVRTEELRSLIQERSRPIRRKFQREATLKGAARVVITANNLEELSSGVNQRLTDEDIQAIAIRMKHVPFNPRAAAYLADTDTRQWVSGGQFAAHAFWLKEKYPFPTNPSRFLLPPSGSQEILHYLTLTTHQYSVVCHWLVQYVTDPQRQARTNEPHKRNMDFRGIRIRNDCLRLTVKTVLEQWARYSTERTPPANVLGRVLRGLSTGSVANKQGVKERIIPLETLRHWARATGFMDPEEIKSEYEQSVEDSVQG